MNFEEYGYIQQQKETPGLPARITAVHKERYALVSEYGEGFAKLKASVYYGGDARYPTVGDFVKIQYVPDGDSMILETLPRRTYFSRRDPDRSRSEQAVAANFDWVFVLQSLNQDFNEKRLERYMTLAWESGAMPVVVLTKADLVADPSPWLTRAGLAASGAAIHVVSAQTGEGLEQLKTYFQPGKTAVFLGSSGVGKSSLVNALAGEKVMLVSGIREDDGKGRHTTTHRQLIRLQNGAMIIDTPGMRELGLWEVSTGLGDSFGDVEQFLGRSRFRDCSHRTEPGCAVRKAIAEGLLDAGRWERYSALKQEAEIAEDKAAMLQRKREWQKNLSKYSRNRNKEVW